MLTMNKKLIIFIVLAVLLIGAYSVGQMGTQQTQETNTVRIASLPNAHGLPVYLAMEKGYFKQAGLNVELVKFEAPNQIIDALMQGQVDLSHPGGATGIVGIADYKNPGKMKVYALAGGDSSSVQNDAILVKKGSPIQSIADLKGKKLGIMAGTIQWQTIARELLAQNDLQYDKDVQIVEIALGLHAQALASGDIDASLIIEPVPTVVKSKGFGTELVPFAASKYTADPFYAGAGIISSDFTKENPNTARRALEVIDRAVKEINDDPNTARMYLKGYTQLDDSTIAKVPILKFKMYNDFTQVDIDAVQKFYNIFTKWNVVDGGMDFKNLIYSPK